MMGPIAIALLCLICFESAFKTDGFASPKSGRVNYVAQTTAGPEKAGRRPPEAAPPPIPGKAPGPTDPEQPPAAPSGSGPLKPFDPTEKVTADQAIDLPADI